MTDAQRLNHRLNYVGYLLSHQNYLTDVYNLDKQFAQSKTLSNFSNPEVIALFIPIFKVFDILSDFEFFRALQENRLDFPNLCLCDR